jgi:hypothetical protein
MNAPKSMTKPRLRPIPKCAVGNFRGPIRAGHYVSVNYRVFLVQRSRCGNLRIQRER